MDVFNKIYSQVSNSVSSAASQLSGVLPGNPVTREFDASSQIASGGPGLLWKIYKGTKRSTKQEAAIFVFEKRQLERWNKTDREYILEALRRGVTQLTKIRHPQVLTVQHPLEESRESLAFATEPVFASLANVLGENFNMPPNNDLTDFKLYDIEIKYGLLQVGEGLAFLHNDVKLIHKNICPESIIINQQGAWKIFGFDFCVHNTSPANSPPFYPFESYSPTLPSISQPCLEYMSPECILTQTHNAGSDIFSLGMLAYTLYSPGNQPLSKVKDLQQFRGRAQQLKSLTPSKLQCIPENLREYVIIMMNVTPELRPDAHQFIKIPYFEDVGVKTLNYLDSLLQWDNLQKSQFYKGLSESLAKLPQRVRLQRVMPCLARDLQQPAMVPFVLPSILDITQHCTQKEYIKSILPFLKPVMKLTEPVQILLIFLQRMELLLKQTPAEDVQQHVLPMLYRGLDSDTPQIHELCLSVLPTFAGLLDHANVKNSLLPRIKKLCLSTSNLSVRVNCLLCVGRLLEHLDKWLVLDEILPFLPKIPSREPAVLMGILGIYKLALTHKKLGISKEIIATRILPFLMPLCIENGLTLSQFNALVALVKEMFQLVETEHRTKLEQLNSVQQEKKVLEATMPEMMKSTAQLDQTFSGLGLDNFLTKSLTIEDKQKIVKQQDTMKILQNQTPLEPINTTTPTNTQNHLNTFQTKDLTSTLNSQNNPTLALNSPSNLTLPLNSHSNLTSTFNQSFTSPTTNINTQFQSLTSPNSMKPAAFNIQSPVSNGNLWNGASQPSQWTSNQSFASWQQQSTTQWTGSNFNQPLTNKPAPNEMYNWSAFDNLLPNTNSSTKTPMNQMMNNQSLLKPTSMQPTATSAEKNLLTNDDIFDLLNN